MTTRKSQKSKMRTLLILLIIVGAASLYIFHPYILGDYALAFFDVGSDTKDQYIMWYNGIVNSLRDGNFAAWDFRNGFGMNTMGHHLTEPFLIPVYICGYFLGPEYIPYCMVWMELIRILIGAAAGYFYLSEFDFSEEAKLIASVMYALNAYVMVWGQHYALGSSVVYYVLILLYAERLLRRKKFSAALCITCCITMMSSFYQGYMCMAGGGIYICIRLLMLENCKWKEKIRLFFLSAGTMVLGVAMSAIRFLPSAAAQIGSSARMEAQESLFERLFHLTMWQELDAKAIIYRIFSSCLKGNGNEEYIGLKNFYEDANLFFSTLFIILLLQYLFLLPRWREGQKRKLMQILITVLCIASVAIPNVTTIFNGFYAPFFRHTFILMPVFAVMSAKTLDYIFKNRKLSYTALVLAGSLMTAVYLKAYKFFPGLQFKNNDICLWMTGLTMAVVLLFYVRGYFLDKKSCILLLLLAVTINMASDSYLCYNYREALSKSHPYFFEETYHSDVNEALEWLESEDPTFYRVEKDYFTASSCFDSLAQNYRGISAYNSNQNANIKAFVENIWPQLNHEADDRHIQFQNAIWDHTLASLCGVKYVLSKSENMNLSGYRKIHQVGEITIYQNESTASLGKFYTKTISEEEFEENKDALNIRELLSEVLILSDASADSIEDEGLQVFKKLEIHDMLTEEAKDTYEALPDENDTYTPVKIELNLDKNVLSQYKDVILQFTIFAERRTVVDVSIDEGYTHSFVQNWESEKEIHIEIPAEAEKITLTITEPQGYVSITDVLFYGTKTTHAFDSQSMVSIDAPQKDSLLTGHILAKESGYVMLPVSNEKGWSIYLNGEKQTLLDADYGFLAFKVDEGEYELTARFRAPLLLEGAVLSLAAMMLFLTITIGINIQKKRRKVK